jgi:hypothetical protein
MTQHAVLAVRTSQLSCATTSSNITLSFTMAAIRCSVAAISASCVDLSVASLLSPSATRAINCTHHVNRASTRSGERRRPAQRYDDPIKRCSDGVGDQGAEVEALWGHESMTTSVVGCRLLCEWLSVQLSHLDL